MSKGAQPHSGGIRESSPAISFRSAKALEELGYDKDQLKRATAQLKRTPDGKVFVAFGRAFMNRGDRPLPGIAKALSTTGRPIAPDSKHSFVLLSEVRLSDVLENLSAIVPAISSARLREDLLSSLGVPFEVEGEGKKRKIKVTPELARALLSVFANLAPFPGTDGRLWVVTTGERYAERVGVDKKGLAGSLLYLRHAPNEGDVVMHFEDLSSVHRKASHQMLHENQEVREIGELISRSKTLLSKLGLWSTCSEEQRKALKDDANQISDFIVEKLPAPRDPSKRHAAEMLRKVRDLKDSLNRDNPTVAQAFLRWAIPELKSRQDAIPRISGYNRRDQTATHHRLAEDAVKFGQICDRAEAQLKTFGALSVFVRRATAPEARQSQAVGIVRNLGIASEQLQEIITRPALTFRDRIEQERAEFVSAVANNSRDSARGALRRIYLLAALFGFQEMLNGAREGLMRPEQGGLSEARSKLDSIKTGFEKLRREGFSVENSFPVDFKGLRRSFEQTHRALENGGLPHDEKSIEAVKQAFNALDFECRLLK